jgi:hypothetical protein
MRSRENDQTEFDPRAWGEPALATKIQGHEILTQRCDAPVVPEGL